MKKFLLIATVLISSIFVAKAQDDQPGDETKRQEKLKALYVAFITEKLELAHGAHRYALGDFGLTAEAVRERFGDYVGRFDLLQAQA